MKHTRRFVTLIIVLAMVLAMAISASADTTTGSITITPPDNITSTATNTYNIYKVFDATGNGSTISYKLVSGKTTVPAGFSVDAQGNVTYTGSGENGSLTADDITAIAGYVTASDLVQTVTSTGSAQAVASGLSNGYYYITTTTGTAVAITSTNPNATVTDKNEVPTISKKITPASSVDTDGKKALAEAGSTVSFEVEISVEPGAVGYVFHDKMDAGLTYKNDVKVYVGNDEITASESTFATTTAANDTITITFVDAWIAAQEEKTVCIKYSATVASDTLSTTSAKNTARLNYGSSSQYYTTNAVTEVYNAKFTVTKTDDNNTPLANAGFVIAKTVADTSGGAAEGATKTVYYKIANKAVSWVDSISDATEYTSDANGAVTAFTGLADGTYTLIEKTVPDGYNKAADSTFTVAAHDYTATNLEQAKTVENKAGSLLPSTGGMGTTIFYILGGILAVGALVVLVTNKRMRGTN